MEGTTYSEFTICQYHDIRGVLEKYFIGMRNILLVYHAMDIWVKRPRLTKVETKTQAVCVARYSAR